MESRLSIFEVAKQANCSIATVSNVLNNKGRISEERRKEIAALVAKLGYRVNSAGRNLRRRRSETVGLLFYPSCSHIFRNAFYAEVMEGLQETLAKGSYHTLLASYEAATAASPLPDFLGSGKVDGLILLGHYPAETVQLIHQSRVPMLLLDSRSPWPVDSIVSDGYAGALETVRHLAAMGHRRIAMVAYSEDNYNINRRVEGFLAGLRKHGLPERDAVLRPSMSHDEIYPQVRQLLDAPDAPTALFAVNDTLATTLMKRLADDGVSIPDRVSFVGFDDERMAREAVPPLTTLRVDMRELGRRGGELMLKRLETPDAPPEAVVLPVELVERASVARL